MKKTLLLVEDEAIIALAEIRQLSNAGYSVLHASTGEKAVEIVRSSETPVDLILMDINLGPGMDGTEAAAEILKTHSAPVVFLSSHTDRDIVEKTEKITSYGYVLKNSGEIVLLASIKMAFKLFEAHRSLQGWNRLMETIIRHDYSAVAVFDKNLVYKYVSARYLRDYRIAEEDIIGKHHYQVFPDIPERWREVHRRVLAGEVISSDADSFFRADGTTDIIRWDCRPWHEADGSIGGLILYSEVITERKKAEEALRLSEERFRSIVEGAPDPIFIQAKRRFVFVNPAAVRLFGAKSEAELLGREIIDRVHPDFHAQAAERIQILNEQRKSVTEAVEQKLLRLDGGEVWVETVGEPIEFRGEQGALVFVRDISRRIQTETGLRRQEENLREAQRIAVLGRWELDIASGRLEWSDTIFEIFEIDQSRFEASYRAFLAAIHPADRQKVDDAYTESLRNKTPYRIEHRLLMKDGRIKWVAETCRTDYDEAGRPVRSVGVVQDITERKAAEETLRSLLREKDTLMRELQHRVKNNLTVISSLLGLEEEKLKDEPVRRVFADARARIQSMAAMYDRLYRSDNLVSIELDLYLRDLSESLFAMYNVRESDASLRTRLAPIELDIKRAVPLGMILNELLTNALKYAYPRGGGGEIRIETAVRDGGITLRVADDGPGLPPDFDSAAAAGTGLALVKALTAQIGGTLRIDGRAGTKVEIRFTI